MVFRRLPDPEALAEQHGWDFTQTAVTDVRIWQKTINGYPMRIVQSRDLGARGLFRVESRDGSAWQSVAELSGLERSMKFAETWNTPTSTKTTEELVVDQHKRIERPDYGSW